MSNYQLVLNGVVPFSTNSAYVRKTFNLNGECRLWRKTVIKALKMPQNQAVMDQVRDTFFSPVHGIVAHITFNLSYMTYFTLKGDVSAKSMDLSNIEKLLIDIIFDERFFERGEIRNCNINDKYILKLHSEKNPVLTSNIVVDLHVYERPSLSEFKRTHNLD